MRKTSDVLETIDRMTGDDPELRSLIADARLNASVAQIVYDTRILAGLTQAQLARRSGTTQSVISRVEDADYAGHSLSLLRRIAGALNQDLEVRFLPKPRGRRSAPTDS